MANIKLITYLLAVMLLCSFSYATLNFTEDFEGYPASNSTWYLASGGVWSCRTGLSSDCVGNSGTPPANASATQHIIAGAGNQFLYMAASGNDNSGGKYSSLYGNFSSYATVQTNWSVVFDYKFYGSTYTSISALPQAQRRTFGGVRWDNFGTYSSSPTGWITATGSKYNSTSQEDFERLRRRHDYSGGFDGQPLNSQCDVNDGSWHKITLHIIYASSVYDYIETYIDGVLCENSTTNINPATTSGGNYKLFNPEAREGVAFGIDNINIYYDELATPSGVNACNDGIDNDGDGFTDYPADPSCSSASDTTESPFDYVQCNNGIDDDLDGFIDYPDDPSCSNSTDTTETPADYSQQPDNTCTEETFCLLKEQFPYDDDIMLHGWYGNASESAVEIISGSNRLNIYNMLFVPSFGLVEQDFNFSHNITNPNKYNDLTYNFGLIIDNRQSVTGTENFYIVLYDNDDREVMRLRYDLSLSGSTETIDVYAKNGTSWVFMFTSTHSTSESDKLLFHTFSIDQVLKTFELLYIDHTGLNNIETTFNWTNIFASKVYRFAIERGNFSADDWQVSIDNIDISGDFADTVCDTWELPYYLVESFNGKLSECGWSVSDSDIYSDGVFELTDNVGFWSAEKDTDLAEEDNTRYVVLSFDLNVINISHYGSTITFRMYDDTDYNFFTVFFRDTGEWLYYNDGGIGKVAGNVTLNISTPYKFVIDLVDDDYDIYMNGTKVVTGSNFASEFANVQNINHFKFQSNDANYELDNVKIYASDSTGTPLLPDEDIGVTPNADLSMCGLFWRNPTTCTNDSDCITNECLPSHKCSSFDWGYCDEHHKVRNNMCVLGGITSCVLSSTGDLILSQFWLFLILLIIIMFTVYLVLTLRK